MVERYQRHPSDHGREPPVVQGAYIYSNDVRAPWALVKLIVRIEG